MAKQLEHDGLSLLHLVLRTRHFWHACIALFRGYEDLIRVAARFLDSGKALSASSGSNVEAFALAATGKWPRGRI